MIILGSQRDVILDFKRHRNAEDYAGEHLSNIRFNGVGKVISVVNKYTCYEDTVDKNDFYKYRSYWKDKEYYNCTSITGKKIKYHKNELGGNSVLIESYYNKEILYFKILHMADIYVKEGDIVNTNTLIGTQGNTGIVLSNKLKTNPTYGSQIHYQVTDRFGNYINPRKFATGLIITNYISQNNNIDKSKKRFKVIVPKISVMKEKSIDSKKIGNIYKEETYTILDNISDNKYNWYKISLNSNSTGWIAIEIGYNWIEIINNELSFNNSNKNITTNKEDYNLIFTCPKTDLYAIKLEKGEKLFIKK